MNLRALTMMLVLCAFAGCSDGLAPLRPASPDDRRAALAYISEQAANCGGIELTDGAYLNRTRPIFQRLVDAAGLNDANISLHIIDCPDVVNALSVNSSAVVVFTALSDRTINDDELAFVIGHELAHITLGHTNEEQDDSVAALLGGIGFNSGDELAADEFALSILNAAGYNPRKGALLRARAGATR